MISVSMTELKPSFQKTQLSGDKSVFNMFKVYVNGIRRLIS